MSIYQAHYCIRVGLHVTQLVAIQVVVAYSAELQGLVVTFM